MSLYNTVLQFDPMAPILLTMLQLDPRKDVPRFRDCWWNGSQIVLLTRTGGGNRPAYESEQSYRDNYPDIDLDVYTGPWNADLRKHPAYRRDEDEEYDRTYAKFYFDVPANVAWMVPQLTVQSKSMRERFEQAIAAMQDPTSPQGQKILQRSYELLSKLAIFLRKK